MESDTLWQILRLSKLHNWAKILLLSESVWFNRAYQKWRTVLTAWGWNFISVVKKFSIGELQLWIQSKRWALSEYEIGVLFNYCKEEVVYGLLPQSRSLLVEKTILERAALHGRMEMVKRLASQMHMQNGDRCAIRGSQMAAQGGHLNILKWLIEQFKLSRLAVVNNGNMAFREASINGHLEVLQWLTERYNITRNEAEIYNNHALRLALRNDHLKVAQWLVERFNLKIQNFTRVYFFEFRYMIEQKKFEQIKWLIQISKINREDAMSNNDPYFRPLAIYGNAEILEWYADYLKLDKRDLIKKICYIMRNEI